MPGRAGLALALFALLATPSCGGPAKGPETAPPPGEWHTFEGSGTTTGQRHTLLLGQGRTVSIFNLTGSVLIVGEQRIGEGFRVESIGVVDSAKGAMGWSVWTDSRGDQVFGEFRGGPVLTGRRIAGTYVGGSGRYAGLTGHYEFEWQYVVAGEDGRVQGRITGLRGRFRRNAPPAVPRPDGPGRKEGPGDGRR